MSTDETPPKNDGTGNTTRVKYPGTLTEDQKKKLPPGKPEIEVEGAEQTFYGVIGAEIGLNQRDAPQSHAIPDKVDPYQWFERSSLTPEEIQVFVDMKQVAEHGIGGEALDIPIPEVAEMIIDDLRARRSRTDKLEGQSSIRFNSEMTAWLQRLKAEEQERNKQAAKGIGT